MSGLLNLFPIPFPQGQKRPECIRECKAERALPVHRFREVLSTWAACRVVQVEESRALTVQAPENRGLLPGHSGLLSFSCRDEVCDGRGRPPYRNSLHFLRQLWKAQSHSSILWLNTPSLRKMCVGSPNWIEDLFSLQGFCPCKHPGLGLLWVSTLSTPRYLQQPQPPLSLPHMMQSHSCTAQIKALLILSEGKLLKKLL